LSEPVSLLFLWIEIKKNLLALSLPTRFSQD